MAGVAAKWGAAADDNTLLGGVVGDKRAFASLEGNPFSNEISGKITWISGPAAPCSSQVRQAARLGL